jgi:transcriptional regulator with XRE-family HTH domain
VIVGKQLKSIILKRGLTAAQVAKLSGTRPQRLSDWLGDASVRDLKQLKSVCRVLGISLDELLFPTEQESFNEGLDPGSWMCGHFEVKIRRIK